MMQCEDRLGMIGAFDRRQHAPMRIETIESFTLRIPTTHPIALNIPEQRLVVASVHTDSGMDGLGYSLVFGGAGSEAVEAYVRHLSDLLLGENPLMVGKVWQRIYRADRGFRSVGVASFAVAALDIALWDIVGK